MSTNPTPMQFDNAEYGGGPAAPMGVACAACKRSIIDQYYEAASQVFCETCAAMLKAGPQGGSRIWRVIEATLGGLMGGVIGAVIYFLILKFTGYEVGLIAILVGFLVGGGVRKGARGRGGWFYQLIAMGLTYLAIVSTYVPILMTAWDEEAVARHNSIIKDVEHSVKISVMADDRVLLDGGEATPDQWRLQLDKLKEQKGAVYYYREGRMENRLPSDIAHDVHQAMLDRGLDWASFQDAGFTQPLYETTQAPGISTLRRIGLIAMLSVFAIALPIVIIKDNIIGLIIIGIALYEAWKMNKRPQLAINGPFVLSPGGTIGQGSIVHVPPPVTPSNPPSAFDEPSQGPTPS